MIPKYLKIKGLYSYQEEAEINFERLSEAHIFGIFGRVGSGKSSILEAITLALYGEVSRMSSRDQRNYNLMNLKSNHLSIEFIFDSANDTYRILVDAERSKKNFEKVERYDFRYFKKENDTWTPLSQFDPKEVIGLERSHFTKAVIIPQNRFQDFLMMADAERNAMMKTLFNLEKYDLMDKVKALEAENNTQVLLTRQSFDRVKDVTKELVDEKNTAFLNLQNLILEQQETLQQAQKQEAEMQELAKQFQQLSLLKTEWETLDKQTPQYEDLAMQLERYQYCRLNFQTLFEQRDILTQKLVETNTVLTKNKTELTDNQAILEVLNKELELLKQQVQQKDALKNELADIQSVLKLKSLNAEIDKNSDSLNNGQQYLDKQNALIEQLKRDKSQAETERQNLRQKQPNFIELNQIKDWYSTQKTFVRDLLKLETEQANLTEKMEAVEKSKRVILAADLPNWGIRLKAETAISEVISVVKKVIEENKSQIKNIQKNIQHDKAMERVEDLAAALAEGEPCPLCGSIHHPSVMNSTDIKKAIQTLEAELQTLEKGADTLQNILIQLDTHSINFNRLVSDSLDKKNEMAQLNAQIQNHKTGFVWQNYSSEDENAVLEAFKKANLIQKELDNWESQILNLNQKWDKETETLAKYQKRLLELSSALATLKGQAQNEEKQIKILAISEALAQSEEDLEKRQNTLEATIDSIEKRYAEADNKLRELTEKVAILRGGVMEAEKNKTALEQDLERIKTQIEAQLQSAAHWGDLAVIENILKQNWDIETEQKRLSQFKEKRYAADKAYSNLTAELKDKNYDKEKHTSLIADNQRLINDIEQQKESATRLEEAIKALLLQLKEHELLKKELRIVENRAANIKTLKSLFTANGFVEYVSSMYLQNLCKAANERFQKLTQQQLRLEVTDKNDFQIRDMLNNGQVRSVRTLSGGQVFQAALSLAIALADSIQPLMRSPQNFFFLDEGFGALDKESLQIVFDTLKALRKENRIVGVISHVEDMQQEIERYLKVSFDVERGSMVELV